MAKRKAIFIGAQYLEPGLRRQIVAEARRAKVNIAVYMLRVHSGFTPDQRAESFGRASAKEIAPESSL